MPNDTRYLEKHGQQWRVSIAVPTALQQAFGKKNLKHPLGTDSLELANEWKGEHVTRFKRMIRDARNGKSPEKYKVDPIITEALQLRSERDEEADALQFGDLDHLQRIRAITPDWIEHSAEQIEQTEGWQRAAQFKAIAMGEATPVISMVDTFLTEQPFKPRQKRDYRRAVEKFDAWCNRKRLTAAIEETDLKVAGRYVSEEFAAKRIPFKTANKDISALSSYWRWLAKKGFTTKSANPWPDQLFPKPKAHLTGETESFKRPFTDEEVEKLLTGNCTTLMHDAMWIAALSGMRVDEIARLTVSGSIEGILRVTKGKTRGAIRGVPTHPLLAAIVKRRAEGKNAGDFLFHELSAPEEDSAIEHSQKVVKQFVVYRRKIGGLDIDNLA
jgi:integrase